MSRVDRDRFDVRTHFNADRLQFVIHAIAGPFLRAVYDAEATNYQRFGNQESRGPEFGRVRSVRAAIIDGDYYYNVTSISGPICVALARCG